ncbi:NCA2-domain-containing protein [Pholiota conissans]|uniref:NCA2-domain-containing protein n=1 Tax=Pholiota conissans TaxID=109636 RepID=A0A9P5YZ02_9AGAR|nr:NCA2-domain-containing protein [Pholiota conissans]
MPSEFTNHFTRFLELANSRPGSPSPSQSNSKKNTERNVSLQAENSLASRRKEELHALLVSLNRDTILPRVVQSYAESLQRILKPDLVSTLEGPRDIEVDTLEDAVVSKLTVAIYSDALDTYLAQAAEVEAEAEWWGEVERSRRNTALYFVQTLPLRIVNVVKTVLQKLRANHLPLNLSNLAPSSLRAVLASPVHFTLQPGLLTTAFFPYLKHQQSLTLATLLPPRRHSSPSNASTSASASNSKFRVFLKGLTESASLAFRFASLPLELTRQECKYNRKALERLRDERAQILGELAELRTPLTALVRGGLQPTSISQYTSILDGLLLKISQTAIATAASPSPFEPLTTLSQTLPSITESHNQLLRAQKLLRPGLWTRLWPSVLVLPPLSLYIYTTRTSWIPAVFDMVRDAKETVHGFIEGWLISPLLDVLKTVRAGGKGDVLVRGEGVLADLESLERMAVALARDSLKYTPAQLETLAAQVRVGDLTPVMQIYEEDIRTPVRSALTGTLLRNLFIQMQKAKVDIDQALSGIDRLLKSQELTFAFVGVAPALAVVYTVLGGLDRLWNLSKGSGSWGGRKRKRAVWEGMRRIERLLIIHPGTSSSDSSASTSITPLSTGLLILSLTRLRSYALTYLPARVRSPFLQDLNDLEDTNLDREAKLRIVDRMWRCWGSGGEGIVRF